MKLASLYERVVELGASDLHMSPGRPPTLRRNGQLHAIEGASILSGPDMEKIVAQMLGPDRLAVFNSERELDFALQADCGRFRVNAYFDRGYPALALRLVESRIRSLTELGLPSVVSSLAALERGLVLVTGVTGSGKSSTLAALIDQINKERAVHILTIEDPIEYLHEHHLSVVNQREVGSDTETFAAALKHALRQDPDVIMVGELRDLESISMAITAAETGHLVFATVHTRDASSTVDRLIDVFPSGQQPQIRTQLASVLSAVVSQQLAVLSGGKGRTAAAEILIVTSAVRNLIRESKAYQIPSVIQSGGREGMQTMDACLADLVKRSMIDRREARRLCFDAATFTKAS